MSGTYKLVPAVIGKSAKARCFKKNTIPCSYLANSCTWMTRKLFNSILCTWNKTVRKGNQKIFLVVDNCSSHLKLETLSHIKVVYMPANSSSILQPLDQGVIAAFKVYYRNLISIRTNFILENNP